MKRTLLEICVYLDDEMPCRQTRRSIDTYSAVAISVSPSPGLLMSPRRLRSYTTSSTLLTSYLTASARLRRISFLRFSSWKPANRSLLKALMVSGSSKSPWVTALVARRASSEVRSVRERRYSSMVRWKASRSLRLVGTAEAELDSSRRLCGWVGLRLTVEDGADLLEG